MLPLQVENSWRKWWRDIAARNGHSSKLQDIASPRREDDELSQKTVERYQAIGDVGSWRRKLSGSMRTRDLTIDRIVDGLEDYFSSLKGLKRVNGDSGHAYEYYRRVGLPLCCTSSVPTRDYSRPLTHGLPGYLGHYFPVKKGELHDNADYPPIVFAYKYRNAAVASLPPDWTSYVVYMCFPKGSHGPLSAQVFAGIDPQGIAHVVPTLGEKRQRLHHKRKRVGQERYSTIIRHDFHIPSGIFGIAIDWWKKHGSDIGVNCPFQDGFLELAIVDRWIHCLFVEMRNFAINALDGIQVAFRRGTQRARIGIPLQMIPTVFHDRNSRQKIFHVVDQHQRQLKDGRKILVGEHFRGTRAFKWRGYDVLITVPSIHHPAIEAWMGTSYGIEDLPEGVAWKDMRDSQELGKLLEEVSYGMGRDFVPMKKGKPTKRFADNPLLDFDREYDRSPRWITSKTAVKGPL